jgi:hypothetical protein
VVLMLLIGVLYFYGSAITPDLWDGTAPQSSTPVSAVPRRVGLPELYQATANHPGLRLAVAGLSILSLGMAIAGIALGVWGAVRARQFSLRAIVEQASGLRHARRKPVAAWGFREVFRIVALVMAMALLLPFVRTVFTAVRPTLELDHLLWMTVAMLALWSSVSP